MKVLVIDDDPDVIEAVSLTFEMRWPGSNLLSSPDGDTGIQMVDIEKPALVLLDIGLADMDGFKVCQEIRRFSDVPIIMITCRDEEADIIHGLQSGADDYILKPFRPIELMARVQTVLRRTHVYSFTGSEKPIQYRDLLIDFARHQVFLGGQPIKLTPIEYQVLSHLAKNRGKIINHRTLLARIWGREHQEDTSNYLKVHIKHLRHKLEDDPANPQYILNERGVGYKFGEAGGSAPTTQPAAGPTALTVAP